MIIGNNASKNAGGIIISTSSGNTLDRNVASSNVYEGIEISSSSNNTLINNIANSNNYHGILLAYSNDNILNGNNVSNNSNYGAFSSGITIDSSSSNFIKNNAVINNSEFGMILGSSINNTFYNNYIKNARNFYFRDYESHSWNITRTAGINIVGGPYLGGNFWANPDGSGFSQTCADNDSDGICDSEYVLASGNIDHLPLAEAGEEPPVALCGPDKIRCENAGAPVQFNASASYDPDGTIVSYYWEFGDGTNGTGMAPKHIYKSYRWNGSAYLPFIVNLTVTDNNASTNRTSQKVVIWMPCDTNGDGRVNIIDASAIGLRWRSADPCADTNNDGKVDISDAACIGWNWGKTA
jgi:parallel beta-helix repeat protein